MRAIAIVLRKPIVVVLADTRNNTTVIYPPDGKTHLLVNPENPGSARRTPSMNTFYKTVFQRYMTAADVAFERDTIVVMYDPKHYYCTGVLEGHHPHALKAAFQAKGHKISILQ